MKLKLIAIIIGVMMAIGIVGATDTAEMTVTVTSGNPTVDSVVVDNAIPTAGSTTQITVTAVATDPNGWEDIVDGGSAVLNGGSYTDESITMNCVQQGIDEDTVECTGTYDMKFYDAPTTYTVTFTIIDVATNPDNMDDTFDYSELIALELDASTIAFSNLAIAAIGTVSGDENMGTDNAPTIQNYGNALIDASISATDFTSTSDSFSAGEAESQFAAWGYVALSNAGRTETSLDLDYGVSELEKVDFELTIPNGALPETFTSTVTITAIANT